MAKGKIDDLFKGLKGFCQKGAEIESPGNIPTGHFNLDFIIQYGEDPARVDLNTLEGYDPKTALGIPLGTLVEIYGEPGGGKSSLAYRICGYAQKLGHIPAWIDCEYSFQKNLAHINGMKIGQNDVIFSNMTNPENPDEVFYGEDALDIMQVMMKNGVKVIILDSVANLIPKALWEAKTEKEFMGLLPRLLGKSMGKLMSHAERYGVLLVFINQLREKIGVSWGDNRTSPGGHSLHHNASLRLRVDKRVAQSNDIYVPHPETGDDMLIGKFSSVTLVKNRHAKPYNTSLEVPIYYESYFPEIDDIAFDTGRQIKLISVRKGIFKWGEIKIEGRKNFINQLKKEKLLDSLIDEIKNCAFEQDLLLPPEIFLYEPKNQKKAKKTEALV
jgi:recombination protein RecA